MPLDDRPVALVSSADGYVGPALCRNLARSGFDLVAVGASQQQGDDLAALGAAVEVVPSTEAGPLTDGAAWEGLVARAVARFGRIDSAALSAPAGPGAAVARGPFLEADVSALTDMYGYLHNTLHALQAVIPVMQRGRGGQVVVFTSDAGARPEAGWSLYGAVRAGQNFLVRAVALEHAHEGICINAIGSKNAVFPGFQFPGFPPPPPGMVSDAHAEPGEWSHRLVDETPLRRMGTMEELAAFATALLDGRNRFQTAQYFSFSGGWNTL